MWIENSLIIINNKKLEVKIIDFIRRVRWIKSNQWYRKIKNLILISLKKL